MKLRKCKRTNSNFVHSCPKNELVSSTIEPRFSGAIALLSITELRSVELSWHSGLSDNACVSCAGREGNESSERGSSTQLNMA